MLARIRLHHILFLLFTLISSVPVLFLTSWVQQSALDKEVAAVTEKHLLVAHNLTGDLSRYITDVENAFRLVVLNLARGQAVAGLPEFLNRLNFRYVCTSTGNGVIHQIVAPHPQAEPSALAATTIAALSPYLQQAVERPEGVFFSDLVRDADGSPTIFVLKALSGGLFVIGALSTDYMVDVQKRVAFGRRGHAAIVDRTGRAIAHPLKSWRETMKDMSALPPVAAMMAGKTGVSQFFTPAMQADMIAGYTVVPRVGWGVMVPQPFEELLERAQDVRMVALSITLLGIGVAGLISWYLAGFLARPIQNVVASARRVSDGHPVSHALSSQSFLPYELHELIGSFNQMVDEIRSTSDAREETARRLGEAQRIAHVGNWVWEIEQDRLWCSEEFYRICNIMPVEFKGNYASLLELIHPQEREVFENAIQHATSGGHFNVEHRILLPDQSERFVHHEGEMQQRDGMADRLVATIHDVTERKMYEKRLIYQANYDELTGLPNRTLFFDRLSQAMLMSQRHQCQVALLFVDLDHFKLVNDTHGHIIGDHLLQQASQRLQGCVHQGDTVARLGGDEFTVVLKNIRREEDASAVACKIMSRMEQPFMVDGYEHFVSASIGITFYPADARTPIAMLRNADIALFRAKESGRSAYRFFTAAMEEEVTNRMNLSNDLHKAIEQDEIRVYYQPIIDLKTGRISSAEALARWHHPQHGNVSPGLFISVAEETGMIGPLGEWVLQQACTQAAAWQAITPDAPSISVNLSVRQLKLGLNKQTILKVLEASGLAADRLTFEITESVIMEDTTEVIAWMKEMKALGIHFSVDDFGTGYSSLSYLKRLPVDVLKIDRAFVKDVMSNPEDASLVSAIIAIGQSLKLKVLAEGVEDAAQLNFLWQKRCHFIQGFYYSKPLPADAFKQLLREWVPEKLKPTKEQKTEVIRIRGV